MTRHRLDPTSETTNDVYVAPDCCSDSFHRHPDTVYIVYIPTICSQAKYISWTSHKLFVIHGFYGQDQQH